MPHQISRTDQVSKKRSAEQVRVDLRRIHNLYQRAQFEALLARKEQEVHNDIEACRVQRPGDYRVLGALVEYAGFHCFMRENKLYEEFVLIEHTLEQLFYAAYTQSAQFLSLGIVAPDGLAGVGELSDSRFIAWKQAHCIALSVLRSRNSKSLPEYGFVYTPTAAAELHAELVHFYQQFSTMERRIESEAWSYASSTASSDGSSDRSSDATFDWETMVREFVGAIDEITEDDQKRQTSESQELFEAFTHFPTVAGELNGRKIRLVRFINDLCCSPQ